MAITTIAHGSTLASGINVFTLPRDRQPALIETLTAINHEILTHKYPMNVSANFHRGIDAPIVINYNQYTDRAQGQFLRTQANVAPLMKRTHDLSDEHEIRWYETADVVATEGAGDRIDISDDRGNIAAIGIFTVAPEKQSDLLALLRRYGEALKGARAPGFAGIATHRGYQGGQVASYEQWTNAAAYRAATGRGSAAEALDHIRAIAEASELHLYDVVSVTRFDGP
jgi:antibiotic biosynthesis monooxygenase